MTEAQPKDGEGAEALLPCPCPFCGSSSAAHGLWGDHRMAVRCFRCDAAGPTSDEVPEVCMDIRRFIDQAITAWNRRAPPATPVRGGGGEGSSVSQSGYDECSLASAGAEPSAAEHLRGMAGWLRETTEGVTGIYGEVAEDIAALNAGADAIAIIRRLIAADDGAPEFGLTDCIDNYGEHYQSADFAALIVDARLALAKALGREAASPLGGPTLALDELKSVPVGGDGEGSSCTNLEFDGPRAASESQRKSKGEP